MPIAPILQGKGLCTVISQQFRSRLQQVEGPVITCWVLKHRLKRNEVRKRSDKRFLSEAKIRKKGVEISA